MISILALLGGQPGRLGGPAQWPSGRRQKRGARGAREPRPDRLLEEVEDRPVLCPQASADAAAAREEREDDLESRTDTPGRHALGKFAVVTSPQPGQQDS